MKRLASLLVAVLIPVAAWAADPLLVGANKDVDAFEVARILNPDKFRVRSVRPPAPAIALKVPFAFDSAKLEPTASRQLDALAEGIKLAGVKVLIEGHTDATGSADYNLRLSQRRAAAVRAYLIDRHEIDPSALRSVGLGKDRPLTAHTPEDPENRRVEFRADR